MAKSHSTELLSKLKASLPKHGTLPAAAPSRVDPDPPVIIPSPVWARAPKLSVSLYQTDLKRLDEIKEFMRSRGHRNLSDSEALRLACRTVEIGEGFIEVYREMQAEDGRKRKAEQVQTGHIS